MNPEKTPRRLVKATMEAVFQSQEKLRKHLDVLIKENRSIKDADERDLFMRELAYSTLGLGIRHTVNFSIDDIHDKKNSYIGIRSNVEVTARWLAYQTENTVPVPMELNNPVSEFNVKVPISELWKCLLKNLFFIFPMSLASACSMSRERDEQSKGKGYTIDQDE